MPWLRQLVAGLSPQRLRFNPSLVHLGFGVDKVTLELMFLQALWFSTFPIILSFINSVVILSVTYTIQSLQLIMSLYDTFKETILQNSWSSKSLKYCKVVAFFFYHPINHCDSYSSSTAPCQVWIWNHHYLCVCCAAHTTADGLVCF